MSEYEIRDSIGTAKGLDASEQPAGGGEVFRHSKKRHETRTNTALHVVLAVICVVWLVPFVFLVCQSFRSFQTESGGMVDYVWPREGLSMDNYKALFIKGFNAKNYTITNMNDEAVKQAAIEKFNGDFTRDFTQGFVPWWLGSLGIAAVTALVITGAIVLLKREADRSDAVAGRRWLILFVILQAVFIPFLLVVSGIRSAEFTGTQGILKVFLSMFLFIGFGAVAGHVYLKQDARLLREIPGYPQESAWAWVKRAAVLFLELTALLLVLLCYIRPNDNSQYITWYGNTLTIALFVSVIQTVIVLSVSYTLSRIRFKGRKLLMNVVLVLGMFPGFLTMVVLYFILRDLGLT